MDELLSYQLPHSTEAEQAVLGAMLIDENCIPTVIERLRGEDFYIRQNRELYESLFTMFNFSQKIDLVTILEQLRKSGHYDEQTSTQYLRQLMEITPTSANVSLYVDIVKDKALLRRLIETSGEVGDLAREGTESGKNILEMAEQRFYSLRPGKSLGLQSLADIVPGLLTRLGELAAAGDQMPGISTGLKVLDRALTGLNKSDLIILAARPGMGKTSMALNMALHAGKFSGKSVVVFSLEMSKEQLGMRLLSGEALIENRVLATGRLNDEDWARVAAAANILSHTNMLIDDDPMLTVADMKAKCRRVPDLGLVVVDYLQLMTSAGGKQSFAGESRQQAVSDISRAMKIMAKELEVPIVCLSQLSRANEKDKTTVRRPRLSDLRDSGAIEQDADIVLFLHREDYYNEEDSEDVDPNSAECIVAKNRHGETGILRLGWRPQFTSFIDPEELDFVHEEP